MEKQAYPTAFYDELGESFRYFLLETIPGKKFIVQKSDGSHEELMLNDCNSNFVANPMTGQKELVINLSFDPVQET